MKQLLMICHWIVLGYSFILVARMVIDSVLLFAPLLKRRILALEVVILALTDPVVDPIRRVVGRFLPAWFDPAPHIAVILCVGLDILIDWVLNRL